MRGKRIQRTVNTHNRQPEARRLRRRFCNIRVPIKIKSSTMPLINGYMDQNSNFVERVRKRLDTVIGSDCR
jgi:hypothetical protein